MPGNLMPTIARIKVPPKAAKIATHTKPWLTAPIQGNSFICLDNVHNNGTKATSVISESRRPTPRVSIPRANFKVSS